MPQRVFEVNQVQSQDLRTISMLTPSGTCILISCLRARSSASRSMSLLWTRVSHLSLVLEPPPSGPFLQGTTRRLVGSGIGPEMATPVFSLIVLIFLQTPSTFLGSVPLSDILALCTIFKTSTHQTRHKGFGKGVYISYFSTSMTMPAATVWPMSLMANLPSCGKSFAFSLASGLVGWGFTIPAAPGFRERGVSFLS